MPRMTAARAAVEILRKEGKKDFQAIDVPLIARPVTKLAVAMGTELDNVVEFEELDDVLNPTPIASGPRMQGVPS
jgi:tartronate-semialdehyde synthase